MATTAKKSESPPSTERPTLVFARKVAKRQSVLVKLMANDTRAKTGSTTGKAGSKER